MYAEWKINGKELNQSEIEHYLYSNFEPIYNKHFLGQDYNQAFFDACNDLYNVLQDILEDDQPKKFYNFWIYPNSKYNKFFK